MEEFLKYGLIGTATAVAVIMTACVASSYFENENNGRTNVDVNPNLSLSGDKSQTNTKSKFYNYSPKHIKERVWGPLKGVSFVYANDVPKLIKRQEKALGCGYACVEALLNKAGKQMTQKELVQKAKAVFDDKRGDIGNLTADEMQKLINCNECNGLVISCLGSSLNEAIEHAFELSDCAVIGCGGHWVAVELDKADDNCLIIHDPFFGKFEDGKSVPKKILLSEFVKNNNDESMQWDILIVPNEGYDLDQVNAIKYNESGDCCYYYNN